MSKHFIDLVFNNVIVDIEMKLRLYQNYFRICSSIIVKLHLSDSKVNSNEHLDNIKIISYNIVDVLGR